MTRAATAALFGIGAAVALSALGCGAADFTSASQITGVRVLASRKSKPYASPGDTVGIDLLWVDGTSPDEASAPEPVDIRWLPPCFDPVGDLYYQCYSELGFGQQDSGFSPGGDAGFNPDTLAALLPRGDHFEVRLPDDIVSRRVPPADPSVVPSGTAFVFFFACKGRLGFAPPGSDARFPFPIGCFDRDTGQPVGAERFVPGYTTLYAYDPNDPRYPVNENPVFVSLDMDPLAEGLPLGTPGAADGATDAATDEAQVDDGAPEAEAGAAPIDAGADDADAGAPQAEAGSTDDDAATADSSADDAAPDGGVADDGGVEAGAADDGAIASEAGTDDAGIESGAPDASTGPSQPVGPIPSTVVLVVDRCTDANRDNCPKLRLTPYIDRSSAEIDTTSKDSNGNPLTEALWIDYYATKGDFTHPVRLVNDSTQGWNDGDQWTEWRAPPDPGPVRLWGVVHDNRGGMNWLERDVIVK